MIQTRTPMHAPPPGADRLSRIRVVPGMAMSAAGRSCHLLLAHDPLESREDHPTVSQDMLGIAAGLGLTPSWRPSRHLVRRAYLAEGVVFLDYGHEHLVLQGPVEQAWYALAAASGYTRLSVALDARPDEGTDSVTFMAVARQTGRLWAGITATRIAAPRGPR
ncbi:hypothetical protein ACGF1Z_31035 [Streptomyces sp. NPDC048018]|uniref:hypothetical protein n=1 Tax=Streptomyces sp. NPDC048018 TaxID=3365499 RepID=UPI0037204205